MTPEEQAKLQEQYRKEREKRDAVKAKAASHLTEEQRAAIQFAFKALRDADWSIREMRDISMEDARNIETAECRMVNAFPDLCIRDCTCG